MIYEVRQVLLAMLARPAARPPSICGFSRPDADGHGGHAALNRSMQQQQQQAAPPS